MSVTARWVPEAVSCTRVPAGGRIIEVAGSGMRNGSMQITIAIGPLHLVLNDEEATKVAEGLAYAVEKRRKAFEALDGAAA